MDIRSAYKRREQVVVPRAKQYTIVAQIKNGYYQHYFNRRFGEDRDLTLVFPTNKRQWRGTIPYGILDTDIMSDYLRIGMKEDGTPTGKYAVYFKEVK